MFRKSIALFLALPLLTLGLSSANAATVPYTQNFDEMASYSGIDFDGNVTSLVTDQPAGEGFTSGKAIKMETQNAQWAGSKFVLPGTSSFISNVNKTGSISVYSPDNLTRCFVMKLEGAGVAIEKKLNVVQGWQTLTFDYTSGYDESKNYNVVALMPDFFGVGCNGSGTKPLTTWYVDNISFPGARDAGEVIVPENRSAPQVLINFEANDSSGYSLIDFGGNSSSVVTDAPAEGSIGSEKALKIVTNAPDWSGTTLIKKTKMASLISMSAMGVKANIYSPVSGKIIMMKLESLVHPSQIVEIRQTSVAGWKTYTFDFTVGGNLEMDYAMASIFVDFLGQKSDNPWYIDDIAFNGAVGASIPGGGGDGGGGDGGGGGGGGGGGDVSAPATPLVMSYEADDNLGALNAFEANPEHPEGIFGGANAVIADAPAGGLGGKVLAITKTGEQWAGLNAMVSADNSVRYTNADNSKVTFNYHSAKSASPVAVQLFNGETMAVELIQYADQGWNNMSFDFATSSSWSSSVGYNKVVIFPDFQVPTSSPADVYYLDNVAVNGAVTPQIDIYAPPVKTKPVGVGAAALSTKTPKVGATLTVTKGTWTGSATISYKYNWYRCTVKGSVATKAKPTSSAKCVMISGQTKSSYKLAKADKGKYIRATITATNSVGSAYSTTKTTAVKVS